MKIKAYAKINLALEVKDSVNGYHMLNNIMSKIDLFDEIEIKKSDKDFIVNDTIENNIILRALKLYKNKYKIEDNFEIKLTKNIPFSAGLGGESTDAAAMLILLQKFYGKNDDVSDLAKELGSDVSFFLFGNLSLCQGRGEIVTPLESNLSGLELLLIKIKDGLSTKEVYKNYEYLGEDKSEKIKNVIDACKNGDVKLLKENIFNDLTSPALKLSENLSNLYEKLNEITNVYLSGSGPCLYVISPTDDVKNAIKNVIDEGTTLITIHLL